MNKEEILEKSRREKEDEGVVYALNKGHRYGAGGMNLMIISRSAKGNDIYKEEGGRSDDGGAKTQGMNSTLFNMMTSMVGTGMNKGANGKKADEVTTPVLDALTAPPEKGFFARLRERGKGAQE